MDLDNATKDAITFSGIAIWDGVKDKRLPPHRRYLAGLAGHTGL
jgi:hypothetical protein